MLADDVNIGKDTVRNIVVEDLRKRKICSRFVPHSLTQRDNRQAVYGPTKSDCARPSSVFARFITADYFLFPKVKSHLKGRIFDSFPDIQKAVTSTLNTTAKDDFYKGIQKLYDRTNLCVQLQEIYVEN